MNAPDTRTRILLAAERLFAERGFASTSLRSLVAEADVNLAAVHYHFGSKEGLIREVFGKFIRPVNEERVRRLDALEAAASPPTLEELLDAWVSPTLEMGSDPEFGGPLARLLGRIQLDPMPETEAIVMEHFQTFGRRYIGCLSRVLPELSVEEIRWRMHFAIGTLTYTLAFAHRATLPGDTRSAASDCRPGAEEMGATRERLVRFLAAAFRAPALEGSARPGAAGGAGSGAGSGSGSGPGPGSGSGSGSGSDEEDVSSG